ncbi:hypothetical protein OIU79_027745 [Salix purpurea]|uniref:Uncharacterized protein n=1 Tax=Salix purpurea TaxID=77065 RepID=A0A9Q1A270_SALPP|nr:hypothetical protein OIU79_027745 [Salix purpurea]
MLSFCRLSLYNNTRQPSSLPRLSWLTDRNPTPVVSRWLAPVYGHAFKRTSKDQSSFIVHAVEKDSQKYEIDSGKAKEALQKLDQQLQAFSDKQISSPKIRASDVKLTRDEVTEEVPRSFRVFPVLQPSVDGPLPKREPEPIPEITATTMERNPPKEAILQLLPLVSEVLIQRSSGGNN